MRVDDLTARKQVRQLQTDRTDNLINRATGTTPEEEAPIVFFADAQASGPIATSVAGR